MNDVPASDRQNQAFLSDSVVSPQPDREFLLSHYETLRQEALSKVDETFRLMRFALVTHGAIWAWLATERGKLPASEIVVWFPLLLSLLFAGLYVTLRMDIKVLGGKLRLLETHFAVPVALSWEQDVDKTFSRTRSITWLLWGLLILANIALAIIL